MESADRPVVLLVDDEFLVLLAIRDFMAEAGFTVLEAEDAEAALDVLYDHPETELVFTDINMPGQMDGIGLAHALQYLRPDIEIVLTSGRAAPARSELPSRARFVEKPYSMGALTEIFRSMLAEGPARPAL